MILLRLIAIVAVSLLVSACAEDQEVQPQTAAANQHTQITRPEDRPTEGPLDRGLPENSVVPGSRDGLMSQPSDNAMDPSSTSPRR